MTPANQLLWEEKVDAQNKSNLFLINSKSDNTKKDLRIAYSQGNKLAYPVNAESMARYPLSMYNIKNVNNPLNKKGG